MPVIAVVNRKGGSGKSTMATHLAAWLARQGVSVMLGDVDRQQSTRSWLKRREAHLPNIAPWSMDQKNILKVPAGISHVVLDTPGGMHGLDLAKVVMSAHAIIIPVCNSLFDRDSAAACVAELMSMPRLATGRCKLGIVGMRIDARTHAAKGLREWADAQNVPFLGVLRETQLYVRCLDSGQTVFDLASSAAKTDLVQWEPILQWLSPFTGLKQQPSTHAIPPSSPFRVQAMELPIQAPRPASLMPAQESLVHGRRLSIFSPAQPMTVDAIHEAAQAHHTHERGHFDGPRLLLRH